MKPIRNGVLILCLIVLLAGLRTVEAQDVYPVITVENVSQIEQVARYGRGAVRMVTVSPDGARAGVATALGLWVFAPLDRTAPQTGVTILLEGQAGAASAAFTVNSKYVAAGGDDGSIMIWDLESGGAVVERLESHLYPVSAVAWGGSLLASGDWSGVVRLWDVTTWQEARAMQTEGVIRRLSIDESAETVTAQTDDAEINWDIANGAVLSQTSASEAWENPLRAGVGTRRAVIADGIFHAFDRDAEIWTVDGFYGELYGVFFTDDNRVGASLFQPTYLWSLESGASDDAPLPVTSPDGMTRVTFGNDGVIHLLDVATAQERAALHGHIRAVNAVAFSPDGRLLASASNDGTIQLWDATVTEDSGSLVSLTGHHGGVTDVAFNAAGTLLASTGYDGTMRLWGVPNKD